MQITETRYRMLQNRLKKVTEELDESLELQREAVEFRDLSENEEYSTSRAASERLIMEKNKLIEELEDAEIIADDKGPRIVLGSVVEVCKVDDKGVELETPRVFRLDTEGDTITQGVLGIKSQLGQAVLNGTNGVYRIQNNGGLNYRVRKVLS